MKAIERQMMSEEKQRAAEIKLKQKEQEKNKQKFTKVLVTRSRSRCATQAKIDNDVRKYALFWELH